VVEMVEITDKEIRVEEILNSSIDKNCGAVVSFTGVVRRENKGKEVKEILYEAYDKMALKVLKKRKQLKSLEWKEFK
jgi:molybdopterin synthase catalytic subunit